jgi:hypothetical protein
MGKYIRKSSTGGGAAPAAVVAGVRMRSRSAALSSAPGPKRPRKAALTRANVEVDKECDGDSGGAMTEGCCYMQLRCRRLFMVAVEAKSSVPVAEAEEEASPAVPLIITASTASVEVSRCSSTASSVDEAALIRSRNDCAAEVRANPTYIKFSHAFELFHSVLVLNYAVPLLCDSWVLQAREDCGKESSTICDDQARRLRCSI